MHPPTTAVGMSLVQWPTTVAVGSQANKWRHMNGSQPAVIIAQPIWPTMRLVRQRVDSTPAYAERSFRRMVSKPAGYAFDCSCCSRVGRELRNGKR